MSLPVQTDARDCTPTPSLSQQQSNDDKLVE